jgi:hypothetical protein
VPVASSGITGTAGTEADTDAAADAADAAADDDVIARPARTVAAALATVPARHDAGRGNRAT